MRIGVVGATGLVGGVALELLGEGLPFPVTRVRAFASEASAGSLAAGLPVEALCAEDGRQLDACLFAASTEVSLRWIPLLAAQGVLCVDKSPGYRMDPRVPLVVPEVNGAEAALSLSFPVISNPNCCAIPLSMALAPLGRAFGLSCAVVSTYQSVSGAGRPGLLALGAEAKGGAPDGTFPHAILGNVIPWIGDLGPLDSEEEEKIASETRRITGADIPLSVTAVRVPVAVGHCLSVTVSLGRAGSAEDVIQVLRAAPGVRLGERVVSPLDVQGSKEVWVSRVRPTRAVPHGVSFWLASDNLRKGAAWNALQILGQCYSRGILGALAERRSHSH